MKNDTEVTLIVARALGIEYKEYDGSIWVYGNRYGDVEIFRPLQDNQWAVPMMVWLVERGCEIRLTPSMFYVFHPEHKFVAEHSPKSMADGTAAVLRCLAEAVVRVAEEGK